MPTKTTTKATKKTTSTKKAQSKTQSKTQKNTQVKKTFCCDKISMKNFLILWGCILAIGLLAVAVFSLLIPMAQAIEVGQSAPSVKHMSSVMIEE